MLSVIYKTNKESFYAFRNSWNRTFYKNMNDKAGLVLLYMASSCINSMLRFGPNGMNSCFGNREYIICENSWNDMKSRIENAVLMNSDYRNFREIKDNSVIFLDPSYVKREMTYNKGFNLENFIDWIKQLSPRNSIIVYTDMENKISDTLIQSGFEKSHIRKMVSTSPLRKHETETGNEVMYVKRT